MTLKTVALAAVFALTSTFALAQTGAGTGTQGATKGVPGIKTNPTPDRPRQPRGQPAQIPGIRGVPLNRWSRAAKMLSDDHRQGGEAVGTKAWAATEQG
jgi:hypothetical protein